MCDVITLSFFSCQQSSPSKRSEDTQVEMLHSRRPLYPRGQERDRKMTRAMLSASATGLATATDGSTRRRTLSPLVLFIIGALCLLIPAVECSSNGNGGGGPAASAAASSNTNSRTAAAAAASSAVTTVPGSIPEYVVPDSAALRMIQDHEEKDPAIERLIEMNRAWVKRTNKNDPEFFPTLGRGQSPDYLYIGCSDSRVAISDLMGVEMGELFVHRNIANMVVSSDINLLSVLTYAVHFLKVKHILVTGHYDCGGVRAAVQKLGRGQVLDAWLQNIRDVYRLHKKELDGIADEEARHRRLVELNVSEQCLNLYKTSIVQSRRLQTYSDENEPFTTPRIHGLVFDPSTGILNEIPIDFRRKIDELKDTYDLFDLDKYEASYVLQRENDAKAIAAQEEEEKPSLARFMNRLLSRLT